MPPWAKSFHMETLPFLYHFCELGFCRHARPHRCEDVKKSSIWQVFAYAARPLTNPDSRVRRKSLTQSAYIEKAAQREACRPDRAPKPRAYRSQRRSACTKQRGDSLPRVPTPALSIHPARADAPLLSRSGTTRPFQPADIPTSRGSYRRRACGRCRIRGTRRSRSSFRHRHRVCRVRPGSTG